MNPQEVATLDTQAARAAAESQLRRQAADSAQAQADLLRQLTDNGSGSAGGDGGAASSASSVADALQRSRWSFTVNNIIVHTNLTFKHSMRQKCHPVPLATPNGANAG